MAAEHPDGLRIDFVKSPISGSAARFFVIILEFILTQIFEIKIHAKIFFNTKKISFLDFIFDFHKPTYILSK